MESNKSNNTVKIFGVKFDKLSSEGAYNKFLTFMSSDKEPPTPIATFV